MYQQHEIGLLKDFPKKFPKKFAAFKTFVYLCTRHPEERTRSLAE